MNIHPPTSKQCGYNLLAISYGGAGQEQVTTAHRNRSDELHQARWAKLLALATRRLVKGLRG